MAKESMALPAHLFSELELHAGDRIEGLVTQGKVELKVVKRQEPDKPQAMTASKFVEKWAGKFTNEFDRTDPRLAALLDKHVK